MSHLNNSNPNHPSQKLQVWYCAHCQSVHFYVGNVQLNFSRKEFSELTQASMEIYAQEFGSLEFYRLANKISCEDNILSSLTVA